MAPIFTGNKFGFGRSAEVSSAPTVFASGGTITSTGITPGNGYRYHVFTSSGAFNVLSPSLTTVEYLVIAGGGSGGAYAGGGGGAGGFRTNVPGHPLAGGAFPVTIGSYPIVVGGGGAIDTGGSGGTTGTPSTFGPITSAGGGKGGAFPDSFGTPQPALNGGSGGGGGRGGAPYVGTTFGGVGSPPGQGNPGGQGGSATPGPIGDPNHSYGGGGGGGAGGAGGNTTLLPIPNQGGVGGAGSPIPAFAAPLIQPEIPAPVWPTFGPTVGPTGLYAGGGGGGSAKQASTANSVPSPGGSGGGGVGGSGIAGGGGVEHTGSGGGGSGTIPSGKGGDGIVIIRYLI